MSETQQTISQWANETFGTPISNHSIAKRAEKELVEMLRKLEENDNHPGIPEEAADIIIVLQRIFERYGVEGHDEVHRKMQINRARRWALDGNGHGQHIEEP